MPSAPATPPTNHAAEQPEAEIPPPLGCVRQAALPCPATNGQPRPVCKARAYPATCRHKGQQAS